MHVDALPAPNEIDHPEIRQAAEKHEGAQTALKTHQKELRDGWRDAEAAKEALAAGRISPSGSYADHIKKLDKLERDLKTTQLAAQSARGDLQAVLNEHGASWVESLVMRAEDFEHAWDETVATLTTLYGQRRALGARLEKLGADGPAMHGVRLKPAQLVDSLNGERLELAYHPDGAARQRRRVVIGVGDVLAALADLGTLEEITGVPGGLGEAFKQAVGHARSVNRGFAPGEENAPAVDERYLVANGRRVAVHMPSSGGDD